MRFTLAFMSAMCLAQVYYVYQQPDMIVASMAMITLFFTALTYTSWCLGWQK